MNDVYYMEWDKRKKTWIVRENIGKFSNHKIVFEGGSLSNAIQALKEG